MKSWEFKGIFTSKRWISPGYIQTDQGKIVGISEEKPDQIDESVEGYLIPGFQNTHSHAFQYAMAGVVENQSPNNPQDDFWSWRETMYQIALKLDPDDLRSVAAQLYSQMVRHGYTSVAEFHYLHHDQNGQPYANLAEHGQMLVEAARIAGIQITLVPVYYKAGGFGKEASTHQRRFIFKDPDHYLQLIESTKSVISSYEGARLGMGIHSIRAAEESEIDELLGSRISGIPFHIHISEQTKEVEDCIAYYGKRPIEWLSEKTELGSDFHLVHATHMVESEIQEVVRSHANVVLCPSTEANLGDGIFPLGAYQELSGKWSIGTDSHVGLNPLEELRLLDYGQRLSKRKRNTWHLAKDSGAYAIEQAWRSGKMGMGQNPVDYFEPGQKLEGVIIGMDNPLIELSSEENRLNTMIYCGGKDDIIGTLVNGEWSYHWQHSEEDHEVRKNFMDTMKKLGIR